jgi:hypothetical protein
MIRFTAEERAQLIDLTAQIHAIMGERAETYADAHGKKPYAIMSAEFRHFLMDHYGVGALAAVTDNREREWTVKLEFWNMDIPDVVAKTDPENVRGLHNIAAVVLEWVGEMHEGDKLSDDDCFVRSNITKRIIGLRAAVSKNGFGANTKFRYKCGHKRYMLDVRVEYKKEVDTSA